MTGFWSSPICLRIWCISLVGFNRDLSLLDMLSPSPSPGHGGLHRPGANIAANSAAELGRCRAAGALGQAWSFEPNSSEPRVDTVDGQQCDPRNPKLVRFPQNKHQPKQWCPMVFKWCERSSSIHMVESRHVSPQGPRHLQKTG